MRIAIEGMCSKESGIDKRRTCIGFGMVTSVLDAVGSGNANPSGHGDEGRATPGREALVEEHGEDPCGVSNPP